MGRTQVYQWLRIGIRIICSYWQICIVVFFRINSYNATRLKIDIAEIYEQPEFYARLLEIILYLSVVLSAQVPHRLELKNDLFFNEKVEDIPRISETKFSLVPQA